MPELLTFLAAFLGGFLSFSGVFITQAKERSRERLLWHERTIFQGCESVQQACSDLRGHVSVLEQRIAFYQLSELDEARLNEVIESHILHLQEQLSQDLVNLESRTRLYRERIMIARSHLTTQALDRSLDLLKYAQQVARDLSLVLRFLHADENLHSLSDRLNIASVNMTQMSRELYEIVREDLWQQKLPPREKAENQTKTLHREGIRRIESTELQDKD